MGTIQTIVLIQSLSNLMCKLWMMKGENIFDDFQTSHVSCSNDESSKNMAAVCSSI